MPKARLVFDGDNVYIGKDARVYNLKSDIASKIDGIPGVIDSLDSTSTTDALSANMGRDLQDQINALSGIGNFLSTWDCTTGLPGTNPQEDPYTYKVGDYYVVSEVGATNYKPHGAAYTQGVASTAVETDNVGINDKYYYDGADWVRVPNTAIQITIDTALSTSSTNAVENRAIANAVNAKQDIISDLSTIRTGAGKGATALQPNDNISQLTNNVGYQTAGDVASAIAGKQDILSAGDGISISNNTVTNTKPGPAISGTAPANPTEGMLWYDSTNDVLKVYDGSAWQEVGSDAADINTKTFYLSSTSDLTTAQAALDWYNAGKNAIICYNEEYYIYASKSSSFIIFYTDNRFRDNSSNSYTTLYQKYVQILFSGNTATSISQGNNPALNCVNVLMTDKNYSTPYTPQYNGSPATKKYVDDSVADVIPSGGTAPQNPQEGDLWYDTVNHVLKIYNGATWETVDTDTTYTAGEGIEIKNGLDYSAMQGPAPDGFHVPLNSEWAALCGILTTTFSMASNATTLGTYLKMPLAGRRSNSNSNLSNEGSYGRYWASTPESNKGYYLSSDSSSLSQESAIRSYGFNVRCFKDTPTIPTSSWTTLYDGSSIATGAGIFYNATDGLISVSGDGQTWYTIQDKNLGATTVYNEGDTLSDANCGYFYQWGNNYGFAHSGTLTTSSTKVDATNYGPGNYYNSSTFITTSENPYDWSSVQNNNLWGGVTGVTTFDNAITNTGVLSVNGQTGDVKVNDAKASAAAPSNPAEGDLWYDTVNDKLMVYDGTNWVEVGSDAADINTKTFYLSATSDTTTAQAALDWYLAGKNPIIRMGSYTYVLYTTSSATKISFRRTQINSEIAASNSYSVNYIYYITINYSSGTVTSVTTDKTTEGSYLATGTDYSTPYTPLYNGSPATKKYVDDKMSSGGTSPSNPSTGQLRYDTTNNILMVYNGSNWVEVGNDMISDAAYSSSWDGDTTHAPSKNAIYDVLGDVETLLANL